MGLFFRFDFISEFAWKPKIAKFVCVRLCLRSFVFVCELVGHDVWRTWRVRHDSGCGFGRAVHAHSHDNCYGGV